MTTTRKRRLALGLLAFALLVLVALAVAIPKIENNLTAVGGGPADHGGHHGRQRLVLRAGRDDDRSARLAGRRRSLP